MIKNMPITFLYLRDPTEIHPEGFSVNSVKLQLSLILKGWDAFILPELQENERRRKRERVTLAKTGF